MLQESFNKTGLFHQKFRDLSFDWQGTPIAAAVARLFYELEMAGLSFRPSIDIGEEWYVLEGTTTIVVPFYLTDSKLTLLERQMVGTAEGAGAQNMMRYLRHETGHAIEHAYELSKDPLRKEVFGDTRQPYPRAYQPKRYVRKFVHHLGDGYAQCHPDEDFAETFAVWLNPESHWRKKYKSGAVFEKLSAMTQILKHGEELHRFRKNQVTVSSSLSSSRMTLGDYYERKCKKLRLGVHSELDEWLIRIFNVRNSRTLKPVPQTRRKLRGTSSVDFISKVENEVKKEVSSQLGLSGYEVRNVLFRVKHRARQLGLGLKSSHRQTKAEFLDFIVDQTLEDIRRGRNKILL
ncbi:MAG: putative zinc-binding metallopeptidase [Bdellovibrionales bacterium]|nr:putative zinc-binding metallopeptidase [Bdellovibrionales bacterium]